MNAKLKKFKKELEDAGGVVFVADDMPDDLAEFWLKEIMSCSECLAEISASKREREREH